jgi:hypothetical protein
MFSSEAQQRRRSRTQQRKVTQLPKSTAQPTPSPLPQTSNKPQQPTRKVVYCFRRKTDATASKIEVEGECTVIEGEIKGDIVQKEGIEITLEGKKQYSATYALMKGEDIDSIDEWGVRGHGYATLILIALVDKPLNDDAEVNLSPAERDAPLSIGLTGSNRIVTNMNLSKLSEILSKQGTMAKRTINEEGQVYLPLLGEFRYDPEQKKYRIFPELEIYTEKGVVKLPVNEIISFKKKAETSKPENNNSQQKANQPLAVSPEQKFGKVAVVFTRLSSWGVGRWPDISLDRIEQGLLAQLKEKTSKSDKKLEVVKVKDLAEAKAQGIPIVYAIDYYEQEDGFKETTLAEGTCTDIFSVFKRLDQTSITTNWDNLKLDVLCKDMNLRIDSPVKARGKYAEYPLRNLVFEFEFPKAIPVLEISEIITFKKVEPAAYKVDPKDLDAYVGKYGIDLTKSFVILKEGDGLVVQLPNGSRTKLIPESENQFRSEGEPIKFVKDANGRVTHLILKMAGREFQFKKLD